MLWPFEVRLIFHWVRDRFRLAVFCLARIPMIPFYPRDQPHIPTSSCVVPDMGHEAKALLNFSDEGLQVQF